MLPDPGNATVYEGYTLVWADEFNGTGYPDPANWGYETGYVRNGEYQEYTTTNAVMSGGSLKIIGCKNNDGMKGKYTDSHYTSGSLVSKGLRHFKYGRYEFRAKVPVSGGAWPVLWMMGTKYEWPACGEIDIMEYYSGWLHANWCWGADHGSWNPWGVNGSYNIVQKNIYSDSFFGDEHEGWFSKFHVWRMDWTETNCVIYIDGVKMNEQDLSKTINKEGYGDAANGANPFQMPQYILMNIAMGSSNGGAVDESKLPMVMEVDYVRCYRETSRENDGLQPVGGIDMTPQEGPEYVPNTTGPSAPQGYHLAWNDEFNSGNTPSGSRWLKEAGSTEYVANDVLVMPLTNSNGSITWGGLDSVGPYAFTNGILEVRARLPMARNAKVFIAAQTEGTANPYSYVEILDMGWNGASPFIGGWVSGNWNGEGGDWFDGGFAELLDADEHWAAQFHVWRYVVDDTNVSVFLDDKRIYSKSISSMGANPPVGKTAALHHVFFWLTTDDVSLDDPLIGYAYEIDYVRCYEPGEGDPIGEVDPPAEPVEQPTNATMQAWFAYTATTEQVVGGAWQDETEDGVKVFLPTASSKDGDLVYVDVTAKFPAVAASKLPSSVTAQGALSAADGYLYVFAASGWTKLVNATVSADAAKSYRVEFDYGSENAPRLRVWEVVDGGFLELEDADGTSWFALTANTFKCFTSLAFSGDGTIGDFIGTSETGPREVVTIEIPSFTDANGDVKGGVALRTVGGKSIFSVTIANGKKGAHYTAFVSNTLSTDLKDWVAAADSTSPDADGLLTLDIIRDDSPAKFAKIVATPTEIKAGTTLDTLAK